MTHPERRAIQRLASLCGVQASYVDMNGRLQRASPAVLLKVLQALGVPLESPRDGPPLLRRELQLRSERVLEPVIVAWGGRLPPNLRAGAGRWHLTLEDGRAGQAYLSRRRPLPAGYHKLTLQLEGQTHHATIVAAPASAYAGCWRTATHRPRAWGVFAPMYAVHSASSWGAGNLRDWRALTDWVAAQGGALTASLPLLAAYLDRPFCEPSPYSPASRLFWNEFYLDIEGIPEFASCRRARQLVDSPAFQRQLRAFRACPLIDWSEQWRVRRAVLQILADDFFASPQGVRWNNFQTFLHRERPDLAEYARFRARCEETGKVWRHWPGSGGASYTDPLTAAPGLRAFAGPCASTRLHLYAQWNAQQQMLALLEQGRRRHLQMYLDLPLGVNPDSYDTWRYRDAFALGATAGCPPDPTFCGGQNWGFAPLHPERVRASGYRYLRDYLGFQMQYTGMLRVDHVMALHRLYWIPQGQSPAEGAFVEYNADELYAVFCLESQRRRTILVGEDLGTVPPEVPKRMARHNLRRMYVVQYSLQPASRHTLPPPPALSVASLNTHDMPPFAAFCQGLDILDRAQLGLISQSEVRAELRTRGRMLAALRTFLARAGLLASGKSPKERSANSRMSGASLAEDDNDLPALFQATTLWLARSRAEVTLLNAEDLWCETLSQNVPATSHERPNWRRKFAYALEQITASRHFAELLRAVDANRRRAARR